MSLFYMQGFEGINIADINKVFETGSWASNSSIQTGRFGGKCLRKIYASSSIGLRVQFTNFGYPVGSEIIVGCAMRLVSGHLNSGSIKAIASGAYTHAWAVHWTTSAVRCKMWDSIQPAYDYTINVGTWYYIEWRYKMANSGGRYQVKVNGTQLVDYTGDTQYSSANSMTGINFDADSWATFELDDIYCLINDATGLTDFLGDCRVDTVFPNGAGNYSQLTPSAGNNYECVDEDPLSTSDYVEGDTDGEKDTYTYQDQNTDIDDNDIYGIAVQSVAQRTQPVANVGIFNLLRTGGTDYQGAQGEHLLNENYQHYKQDVWEKDPSDTNDWTKAKINACEFGVEVNKT